MQLYNSLRAKWCIHIRRYLRVKWNHTLPAYIHEAVSHNDPNYYSSFLLSLSLSLQLGCVSKPLHTGGFRNRLLYLMRP